MISLPRSAQFQSSLTIITHLHRPFSILVNMLGRFGFGIYFPGMAT
jgi:hypothetical protein